MLIHKTILSIMVICLLAITANAGEVETKTDSMNKVVTRLLYEGFTTEQINTMKEYPVWPTCDIQTGLLSDGIHRFVSEDRRVVILYHVKTVDMIQTVTRDVLYDLNQKKKSQ